MRKFWWIPAGLVILACGGSGFNFTFPYTKTLAIEFRNTGPADLEMWGLPDAPTVVAAGASRTEQKTRTWLTETQNEQFIFHATPPGLGMATVQIELDGKEAQAQNLSGILVTWDGTEMRAVTR